MFLYSFLLHASWLRYLLLLLVWLDDSLLIVCGVLRRINGSSVPQCTSIISSGIIDFASASRFIPSNHVRNDLAKDMERRCRPLSYRHLVYRTVNSYNPIENDLWVYARHKAGMLQ